MKYILCLLLLLCWVMTTTANDPGLPGEDPDVPLDGGISLLLLTGAAYGVREIRRQRKN
uniref:PID-CTERM protein-sorting domain-containing protein n=1 Tax=Pedobacter schmidteae TaxID=2201271 RepID=UPI0013CF1D4B|nr:hypothetical protein [Pedobacter schmidteae]